MNDLIQDEETAVSKNRKSVAKRMMKEIANRLSNGEVITFNPRGNSMTPRIKSGQEVTVVPLTHAQFTTLQVGDVVLCKVRGNIYLHLITAIDINRGYQISNNHGRVNGWTKTIYGKALV